MTKCTIWGPGQKCLETKRQGRGSTGCNGGVIAVVDVVDGGLGYVYRFIFDFKGRYSLLCLKSFSVSLVLVSYVSFFLRFFLGSSL